MLEARSAAGAGAGGCAPQDQASGLRRLFAPRPPRCLPVLLAAGREAEHAQWLARLGRACAEQGSRTLLIDAARTRVASAFGLALRYDLQHALCGDCEPGEVVARALGDLAIVPAARAFDSIGRSAQAARRFGLAVQVLAARADCAVLVLPAPNRHLLAQLCDGGYPDVLLVAGAGPQAVSRCLDTMRAARGAAPIETFRLLFHAMEPAGAGSLITKLAAAAARELGADVVDGGCVTDPLAIGRVVRAVRCRMTPEGAAARGGRRSAAVETGS